MVCVCAVQMVWFECGNACVEDARDHDMPQGIPLDAALHLLIWQVCLASPYLAGLACISLFGRSVLQLLIWQVWLAFPYLAGLACISLFGRSGLHFLIWQV